VKERSSTVRAVTSSILRPAYPDYLPLRKLAAHERCCRLPDEGLTRQNI
jgi:hypothetical protein